MTWPSSCVRLASACRPKNCGAQLRASVVEDVASSNAREADSRPAVRRVRGSFHSFHPLGVSFGVAASACKKEKRRKSTSTTTSPPAQPQHPMRVRHPLRAHRHINSSTFSNPHATTSPASKYSPSQTSSCGANQTHTTRAVRASFHHSFTSSSLPPPIQRCRV